MDKLKMQTPDLTDNNIVRISVLFPNVITETRDENGIVKKAVNLDLLKQVLSKSLVEDDNERYQLDWPGKKASLLKANTPITKTLRPYREESVNFDTTENLYIEGDNFEVLKILQESYLGKVKMIYIDPPYNTGNDFIYKDNFAVSKEEYEDELGAIDEEGGKLFRNTDSNGRFHSDWLSMMYERLVIARDLLKDDGVIFISIDDNEVNNLRKLCDENFGEENFATDFIIKSNPRGSQSNIYSASVHEHLLCYIKNASIQSGFNVALDESMKAEYSLKDEGGLYRLLGLRLRGGAWRREERPFLYYPIYINQENGTISLEKVNAHYYEVLPIKPSTNEEGTWRWSKEKIIKDKNLIIAKKIKRDDQITWDIFQKDYLCSSEGEQKGTKAKSIWDEKEMNYQNGTNEVKKLFDGKTYFDFPKPFFLIKKCIEMCDDKDSTFLDFFAGSATTAHAVMQINAEDGGNRRFIMVQLPELCEEKSEAFKAGYKTIAEIGKERIRRAGKKIVEELKAKNLQRKLNEEPFDASKLDIGFRVYKTDDTNMKDVFYHPNELKQDLLSHLENNIKEDRTPEDLLTQIILDLGLELSLPIETKKILGNTVYIVQTNALVACFDNDIDFKIVDTISDLKPLKVVFKDASFKDDKDRVNVEERFKRLSSETKVTVI